MKSLFLLALLIVSPIATADVPFAGWCAGPYYGPVEGTNCQCKCIDNQGNEYNVYYSCSEQQLEPLCEVTSNKACDAGGVRRPFICLTDYE